MQLLQQKFDDFLRDLQANEERVTNINVMKETLVEGHHSCTEQITERCTTINSMWFEVRELAQARHEVNCVSLQNVRVVLFLNILKAFSLSLN